MVFTFEYRCKVLHDSKGPLAGKLSEGTLQVEERYAEKQQGDEVGDEKGTWKREIHR